MKLRSLNFFSFCCITALFGKGAMCRAVNSYETKLVKGITEVSTRNESNKTSFSIQDESEFDVKEILEEERLHMCKGGLEILRHHTAVQDIQWIKEGKTQIPKYYLLEIGETKWSVTLELLSAFKCPTIPATYIHVREYNERAEMIELSIIFKKNDPLPNLEDIMSYQVKLVKDVVEAFTDEIRSKHPNSIENSLLDTDELAEEERLQICRKAVHMVPETNAKLLENIPTSESKYYVLSEDRLIDDLDSSTVETSDIKGIFQLFRCPTTPEIYIHINDEEESVEHVLWVILKESERRPLFEIMGYQLGVLSDIVEVPLDEVRKVMRRNPLNVHESTINFDELTEEIRREVCQKAIQATLGSQITLLPNVEIGSGKFYALRAEEYSKLDDEIVQAISCPTNSPSPVYVHANKRKERGAENMAWVLVKLNIGKILDSKFYY